MVGKFKNQKSKIKNTNQKSKFFKTFYFLLAVLTFTFLLLSFIPSASAQTQNTFQESVPTWKVSEATPATLPSTVSPTSPIYTDLLVNNLFHSFSCLAVGQSLIGQPCLTYQITRNAQGAIQSIPVLSQANLSGGALGATTSLIGMLYANPPVRTVDYLASVGEGLGIVKEAKAQVVGSGAQVLNPILKLWQVSRNISYLIMIIIFVIIGLMVMFRQRINPQTVITAQAALPGLVIGLILITFSYFLAGLISDTAFIGTNMVGYYFTAAQEKPAPNLVSDISSRNILSIFTPFTKVVSQGDIASALGSIWDDLADPTTNRSNPFDLDPQKVIIGLAGFVVSQILMPFGSMFGGPGQIVAGIASFGSTIVAPTQVVSVALAFIAMAILIYAMFRLLLRLINNFLSIIFLTITAPFQFLAAALPGRQGLATNWILNMLANILAFPAVLAVLYFVAFIVGPSRCPQPSCPFIVSQLNQTPDNNFGTVYAQGTSIVGNQTFPLFGGMDLSFIRLLLAFGALVALPSIPDIIARTVGRVGVAGQLIGQELGGSIGQGRGYAGQFQSGVTGLAGQAGRLTNQPGIQYIADPNVLGGFRVIPTSAPGQISRFKTGLTSFRAGIKNRFGF